MARFYERDYPAAARSLREGLNEMFTLQRLQIPPIMHKCLATTNLIESPQSAVRRRTLKISRWRDQDMAPSLGRLSVAGHREGTLLRSQSSVR